MASPATSSSILLLLPIADATRLARPDLNPGIARLRIERIAVASRELGSSRAAQFLRTHLRQRRSGNNTVPGNDAVPGNNDVPRNNAFGMGLRFHARLRALASRIG